MWRSTHRCCAPAAPLLRPCRIPAPHLCRTLASQPRHTPATSLPHPCRIPSVSLPHHREFAQKYVAVSNATSPCPPIEYMYNPIFQHFYPQHCRCGGLPVTAVASGCPQAPISWTLIHVEDGAQGAGAKLLQGWTPRLTRVLADGWGDTENKSFFAVEDTV